MPVDKYKNRFRKETASAEHWVNSTLVPFRNKHAKRDYRTIATPRANARATAKAIDEFYLSSRLHHGRNCQGNLFRFERLNHRG